MRRIFEEEQDFRDKFEEYLEYCEVKERLPNVAGFCYFAKIGKTTFYDQKGLYPNSYAVINCALEDEALNNRHVSPSVLCLYLKNKCKYADKVEQVVVADNTNSNTNFDLSKLTFEQLKELAYREDKK